MKPRRWFRFSLRTLFVLLTLLGVWLSVQVKWHKDRQRFLERNRTPGFHFSGYAPAPPRVRWFARQGVARIWVPKIHEATARRLFPEAVVSITAGWERTEIALPPEMKSRLEEFRRDNPGKRVYVEGEE